jgi:multidrug transporter EmrE-like cation transporter
MSVTPIVLVVVSLVCYQLAAKLSPAEVTPWVTLAVVYAIAFSISLWRVLADAQMIMAGSLTDLRFLLSALVLGLAVIGIEYGYLAAHRSGWPLAVVGLVGAAGGTAVLAVVGVAVFSEALRARAILGLTLCLGGLALIAWRPGQS